MSKRIKTIPKFASEAAERAFWEKNDSTGYFDSRYWHLQSADTVRLPAHSRSAATFSAITTANGRVFCISCAIMAALTG